MALTRPKYSSILDTDFKVSCKVATTGSSITLTGGAPNTLDGEPLSVGDRILVRDQSPASENGVYVVTSVGTGSNGTWTRAKDFASNTSVTSGIMIPVTQGNTRGGRIYLLTTPDPISLNTTGLTFTDVTFPAANVLNLSNSTVSTSTTTGAMIVAGGVGIGGNIYVGENANVAGNANVGNIVVSGNSNLNSIANVKISGGSSGQFIQTDGTGNLSFVTLSPNSIFNGTSNVSVASSGNVTVSVAGNANVVTVTGTGANIAGTANVTGNLDTGNISTNIAAITTGNITTINSGLMQNGNSNIAIAANGNVTISADGKPNVITVFGNGVGVQKTILDSELSVYVTAAIGANINQNDFFNSAQALVVGDFGKNSGITIVTQSNGEGSIYFADGNTGSARGEGYIYYDHTAHTMTMGVYNTATSGSKNVLTISNSNATVNGNIIGSNISTAGTLNVTGNANVGNLGTAGLITATGNVTGGNLVTAGILSVTGTSDSSIAGNLNMNNKRIANVAAPVNLTDAANKQYVDEVAEGLKAKPAVELATTASLTANYNNGTLGVGATLTATTNVAFPTIDGITLTSTTPGENGVLVKNQSNPAHNGRYNLTQQGDGTKPWILTRCGLCDEADEIPGAYVFVKAGTLYGGTGWVQTVADPATFVVGTDAIIVTQFSGAGTYTAGTGLTLTGTTFSVNASQTQVTSVGTLGSLSVTGNISAGNVSATTFTGALSGAATTAGTVTTAAQPNITSVGTLTSLAVTGNITGGNVNTAGIVAASRLTSNVATGTAPLTVTSTTRVANLNVANAGYADSAGSATSATSATTADTVTTAAQPNITSVGTLTSLSVTGNISAGNVSATTFTGALSGAATTAGTVTTAAQPNITSVGTLTSLSVTGNANTGNLGTGTVIATTGNITTINSGLMQNGNSNVAITANGNVTIAAVGGTRITATSTGANVTGTLGVSGNANTGNLGTGTIIATTANLTTVNNGVRQNGNSNVTITANSNVSVFVNGNATARAVFTSTGANIAGTLDITGNVTLSNLTANGTVNLGSNANVKITGGTANQFLKTDGAGNLSWSGSAGGISFTASATAPSSPSVGDQWYDTGADILFTRINDGSGDLWLDLTSTGNTFSDLTAANISVTSNANIANLNANGVVTIRGYTGGTVGSAIATYTKSLVIGGVYNQPYNSGNAALVHIADYSNDTGENVYPIYVEDENNVVDFYLYAGTDGTANTKRAYFGGNVGIGNTAPVHKLSVTGTMNVSANANVGNLGTAAIVATGNATITGNISAANINRTFPLPNTLASASYVRLGTFTAAQNGQHCYIKVVASSGYNALTAQQLEVNMHFLTSNGTNVDANGFAGWLSYDVTNSGTFSVITKAVSNAAGTSATSYDLWVYLPSFTGNGSFYTVEINNSTSTWTHIGTTGADPGAAANTRQIGVNAKYFASNVLPSANATYTLGSTSLRFSNIWGLASSAQYADLAEKYLADMPYDPGTVVIFGGSAEITVTNQSHDARVAGVISTEPAYLMNDYAEQSNLWLPVALTGRVPCQVQGPVKKGDVLVASSMEGVAEKLDKSLYEPGCVIGKSLEDHMEDTIKTIEVVVGRF